MLANRIKPIHTGLKPDGTGKRTWSNSKDVYYNSDEVFERIHLNKMPYKRDATFYNLRDLGLCVTLWLSSGRIGEVLKIKRSQIKLDEEDKRFLLIHNFAVSKRKRVFKDANIKLQYKQELSKIQDPEKRRQYRDEMHLKHQWTVKTPTITIPCPLVGPLSKFTDILAKHLEQCRTELLFPISKSRAWRIVNTITGDPNYNIQGVWCHWFRAESLSYHLNLLRSTIVVSEAKGVVNSETLRHYFTGSYRQFADELAGGPVKNALSQATESTKTLPLPSLSIHVTPDEADVSQSVPSSSLKVEASIQAVYVEPVKQFIKIDLEKKIKNLAVKLRNIERCEDVLDNSANYDFSKYEGGWNAFRAKYEPQIQFYDELQDKLAELKIEYGGYKN